MKKSLLMAKEGERKQMQLREHLKDQQIEGTDGILAEQTLAGDQRAFEQLVYRYSAPLFNFISRYLNDPDAASDVLQHVFTQLYLSLPKLRTGEPLKAWLFRVARNRSLDELRRKRAIHFSELQTLDEHEDL